MNSLYFLIPAALILIFMCPIFMEVRGSYNVLKNQGALGIFFFGIHIKSLMFRFEGKDIRVKEDDEIKEREFDFESNEGVFYTTLVKQIINKTKLKLISILYNIGFKDAFATAMMCGYLNTFLLILLSRVKSSKPTCSMLICDNPSYNSFIFELVMRIKFSISLFDLVYSLIVSLMLTGEENARCS